METENIWFADTKNVNIEFSKTKTTKQMIEAMYFSKTAMYFSFILNEGRTHIQYIIMILPENCLLLHNKEFLSIIIDHLL